MEALTAALATGVPPVVLPLPVPTTAASSPTSITQRAAESIVYQIVLLLERHEIKTVDDLATNARLRQLSNLTFEALPGPIRLSLSYTVGREFIDDKIFDIFLGLRASLLTPETGKVDLRDLVRAQLPTIAAAIEGAVTTATASVGSLVTTNWSSMLGSVWGNQQHGGPQPQLAGPARIS